MTNPEASSNLAEAPAPVHGTGQPLSMRIYFQPHVTELVRLIGYDAIPVDEAREKVQPLLEKYGEEKLRTANDELIEVDQRGQPQTVRLREEVLKMAAALLGPRPQSGKSAGGDDATQTPAATSPIASNGAAEVENERNDDESADESDIEDAASNTSANETATVYPEVSLPRDQVLAKYLAALTESGKTYVQLLAARATIAGSKAFAPDLIVFEESSTDLLTVRRKITTKQVADLKRWLMAFRRDDFEARRVWPVDAGESWMWRMHPVDAQEINGQESSTEALTSSNDQRQ